MVFGMSGMANFAVTNSTNATTADVIYLIFNQRFLHGGGRFTTIVSSVSVLVLIVLGMCVYFCARRSKPNKIPFITIERACTPNSLFDSNPIERMNVKSRKTFAHQNIITPDRHIAFVIPTVPLHAQAINAENQDSSEPTSSYFAKVPLTEQQYYPQLYTEDATLPKISFTLVYQLSTQILHVKILSGSNFPEEEGKSHAVQVKLYPGRGSKQRTKDYTGGNPVFNQEFRFNVRKQVLRTKVLKLRVMGIASSSPKTVLGIVNLAMKDLPEVNHGDVNQDFRTGTLWRKVEMPSSVGGDVRLEIAVKWTTDPSPGLLILKIREAYGLQEIPDAEYTSTYVKVTLQENGRTIKSRKTRLLRWGSTPNYDDTFVVTIPFDLLSQISFTLTLVARGRLGSKAILGKIHLGPVTYASPQAGRTTGTELWEDMCHQPNTEISRWLQLFT